MLFIKEMALLTKRLNTFAIANEIIEGVKTVAENELGIDDLKIESTGSYKFDDCILTFPIPSAFEAYNNSIECETNGKKIIESNLTIEVSQETPNEEPINGSETIEITIELSVIKRTPDEDDPTCAETKCLTDLVIEAIVKDGKVYINEKHSFLSMVDTENTCDDHISMKQLQLFYTALVNTVLTESDGKEYKPIPFDIIKTTDGRSFETIRREREIKII